MRKKLLYICALFITAAMMLPLFGSFVVNADPSTRSLLDATSNGGSFDVKLTCGGVDLYTEANPQIYYGDPIVCELDWSFPNRTFELNPNDVLTYDLPGNLNFAAKTGKILGVHDEELGDYTISGNQVTIVYTDPGFCSQDNRIGHLAFTGSVDADSDPAADPDIIRISFPGKRLLEVTAQHRPVTASLTIDKTYDVLDDARHIYEWRISITATGDQTNVSVRDTMWPGMELIGDMPKAYTDWGGTSEYGDYTGFAFEGNDQRTFSGTINHMSDGQTLYVIYDVQIDDAMYDRDAGNDFVTRGGYTGIDNYYPSGYNGTIPNRVTVHSDQAPDDIVRTTEIYGAGYSFVKWYAAPVGDELEHGILRWQLFVNKIRKPNIQSGYIVDTLPANLSFDINDVTVYDGDVYSARNTLEYLDIRTTPLDDGRTRIEFIFRDPLMAELHTINKGFYIEYTTHVERQTGERQQYINYAELFYNGATEGELSADVYYVKPDEVIKSGEYNAATAPFANYVVVVNQAEMDIDPNSNTLTLSDTLGSALDLDTSTIQINGVAAAPGTYNYDPLTRELTITLNDETYYRVTYSARVNLIPGATLDSNNATNTCALSGIVMNGAEDNFVINSRVHNSAASSSSDLGLATFNIIKHDESSAADVLPGATFRIAEAVLTGSNVTSVNSVASATTDANGRISFDSLARGTCYMINETAAPAGYDLDDSLRFIIFAADGTTSYPAAVTYNGTSYPIQVIDHTRASIDQYISNSITTTGSTQPSASSSSSEPSESSTGTTPSTPSVGSTPSETSAVTTPSETAGTTSAPSQSDATTAPSDSSATTPATTPSATSPDTTATTPSSAPSDDDSSLLAGDGRRRTQDEQATPSESSDVTEAATPTPTPTTVPASTGRVLSTGEDISLYMIAGAVLIVLSGTTAGIIIAKKGKGHS